MSQEKLSKGADITMPNKKFKRKRINKKNLVEKELNINKSPIFPFDMLCEYLGRIFGGVGFISCFLYFFFGARGNYELAIVIGLGGAAVSVVLIVILEIIYFISPWEKYLK